MADPVPSHQTQRGGSCTIRIPSGHPPPVTVAKPVTYGILDMRQEPTIPVTTAAMAEARQQWPQMQKKLQGRPRAIALIETAEAGTWELSKTTRGTQKEKPKICVIVPPTKNAKERTVTSNISSQMQRQDNSLTIMRKQSHCTRENKWQFSRNQQSWQRIQNSCQEETQWATRKTQKGSLKRLGIKIINRATLYQRDWNSKK